MQFLSNERNITFTLVSSYTSVMPERPKEYDVNSYEIDQLALFYRLHRLLFCAFKVHINNLRYQQKYFSSPIEGRDCMCNDKDDSKI